MASKLAQQALREKALRDYENYREEELAAQRLAAERAEAQARKQAIALAARQNTAAQNSLIPEAARQAAQARSLSSDLPGLNAGKKYSVRSVAAAKTNTAGQNSLLPSYAREQAQLRTRLQNYKPTGQASNAVAPVRNSAFWDSSKTGRDAILRAARERSRSEYEQATEQRNRLEEKRRQRRELENERNRLSLSMGGLTDEELKRLDELNRLLRDMPETDNVTDKDVTAANKAVAQALGNMTSGEARDIQNRIAGFRGNAPARNGQSFLGQNLQQEAAEGWGKIAKKKERAEQETRRQQNMSLEEVTAQREAMERIIANEEQRVQDIKAKWENQAATSDEAREAAGAEEAPVLARIERMQEQRRLLQETEYYKRTELELQKLDRTSVDRLTQLAGLAQLKGSWGDTEREEMRNILRKAGVNVELMEDYFGRLARQKGNEGLQKTLAGFATDYPFLASMASALTAIPEGVAGTVNLIGQNIGNMTRSAGDYRPVEQLPQYASTIRGTVAENLKYDPNRLKIFGQDAGAFLYQTGMSSLDSAVATAASGGLGAVAGLTGAALNTFTQAMSVGLISTSAVNSSFAEAKARGLSDQKATSLAWLSGLIEAMTEKYSVEALLSDPKNLATYFLKNVVAEGSEETVSEIAGKIADMVISGEKSEWQTRVRELQAEGLPENRAVAQAFTESMTDVAAAGLGGALSGGGMAIGGSVTHHLTDGMFTGRVTEQQQVRETALQIMVSAVAAREMAAQAVEEMGLTDPAAREEVFLEEYERLREEVRAEAPEQMRGYVDRTFREVAQATQERMRQTAEPEQTNSTQAQETPQQAQEAVSQEAGGVTPLTVETAQGEAQRPMEAAEPVEVQRAEAPEVSQKRIETPQNQEVSQKAASQEQKMERQAAQESNVKPSAVSRMTMQEAVNTPAADPGDIRQASARIVDGGASVTVTGIEASGEGEMILKTSDGQTMRFSDLVFEDEAMNRLFKQAEELDTVGARALLRHYHGGAVGVYQKAFDTFRTAGIIGYGLDKAAQNLSMFRDVLTKEAMIAAYNTGVRMAEAERTNRDRTVARKGTGRFTDKSASRGDAMGSVLEAWAKKTGHDVERIQSRDKNGKKMNGAEILSISKAIISADADSELGALTHETAEYVEFFNSEGMAQVKRMLAEYMADKMGLVSLEAAARSYQRDYKKAEGKKSLESAVNEMMFDALGGIFSTDEGAEDFIRWVHEESGMDAEEQKGFFERIAELIQKLIDAVKSVLKGDTLSWAARQTMDMEAERAQEIRKLFLDAADKAIENYKGAKTNAAREGGEVRYSFKGYAEDGKETFSQRTLHAADISNRDVTEKENLSGNSVAPSPTNVNTSSQNSSEVHSLSVNMRDVHGFQIREGAKVNEDLLEELSIHDPSAQVDPDGNITVYHRTNAENAQKILDTGIMTAKEDALFFSSKETGYADGYGDVTVKLKIPSTVLRVNDIFEGEVHFDIPLKYKNGGFSLDVSRYLEDGAEASYSITVNPEEGQAVPAQQHKNLLEENEKLREINENLRQEFRLTKGIRLSEQGIRKAVSHVITQNDSKVKTGEIIDAVRTLYNSVANLRDNGLAWQDFVRQSREIAEIIYDNRRDRSTLSDYSQEVRSAIKGVKLTFSDELKQEMAYYYGSWNNFRKAAFGRLNIVNKGGVGVDTLWASLHDQFPGLIGDEMVSEKDIPLRLMEIWDAAGSIYDNAEQPWLNRDEAISDISYQILDAYFEVPEVKTWADRNKAKMDKLRHEHRNKMNELRRELREKYQTRLKEKKAELRDKYKQKLKEQTMALATAYELRMAETLEQQKEREAALNLRKKISSTAHRLDTRLTHETDSRNIPENLRAPVAKMLSILTGREGVFTFSELAALRYEYEKIQADAESNGFGIDEELGETLKQMQGTLLGKKLTDLTLEELYDVYDVVEELWHMVKDANTILVEGRRQKVEALSQRAVDHLNERTGMNVINTALIKPDYLFRQLGGELERLWKEIRNGENKWMELFTDAQMKFAEISHKYNAKKWYNPTKKISFTTEGGEELQMTLGQMMSIYALSRRAEAMSHLTGGGVTLEDVNGGLIRKGKEAFRKVQTPVPLTFGDIVRIGELLTDEQKGYARELQDYLSNEVAEWGNEVSMALYGIRKFRENTYFPIMVESNYIYNQLGEKTDADRQKSRLKNRGFTKRTQPGASNPVRIMDISAVWARHVNEMALYNALVLPMDNFNRVFNYVLGDEDGAHTNAKAALQKAFGKKVVPYIEKLFVDINGGVQNESTWADLFLSRFKKSAVAANLQVVAQQPSAIARALKIIPMQYMLKSTTAARGPKTHAEMMKYAPIARIKALGGFDTGTGKSLIDEMTDSITRGRLSRFGQKADDIFSFGAAQADMLTWRRMWVAVKAWVADTTDLEVGSEEFLQEAGRRFTEVMQLTQVYDSVFARSGIERNRNGFAKMAAAFMAEPLTSYNVLREGATESMQQKSMAPFATALGIYITNVALNSILKALMQSRRDKDDNFGYLEKLFGNIVGNMIDDPMTMFPYLKDIVSVFQGYDVERMDMTLFSNLKKAFDTMMNENKDALDRVLEPLFAIANLFGVPAKNIWRDIEATIGWFTRHEADTQFSWRGVGDQLKDNWPFPGLEVGTPGERAIAALEAGDTDYFRRMIRGKSDQSVNEMLRGALKDNEPMILEAAKLWANNQVSEYQAMLDDLAAKYGPIWQNRPNISTAQEAGVAARNDAIKAAEGVGKKLKKLKEDGQDISGFGSVDAVDKAAKALNDSEKEEGEGGDTEDKGDFTDYTMLKMSLDDGDLEDAQIVLDDLLAHGKEAKNAKSSLTRYYKEKYLEGDKAERDRIVRILTNLKADGKPLYDATTIRGWE